MNHTISFLLATIMTAGLVSGASVSAPQQQAGECDYFIETGYYVCDEFLEFFETRGTLEIFGYPLTDAFYDPARGLRVQYFQRARMEWHPYNQESQVLLGLLVDEMGHQFPAADAEQVATLNSRLERYFPETGHIVSYAFLDYFDEKGGLEIFGYPRSEIMYEDGYMVQYFQRARMEWHPEIMSGPQVRLTKLGEMYLVQTKEDELPERVESPPPPVTALHVSASVRNIITGQEGTQTVFVYVTDQLQRPVQNVAVGMAVGYQSSAQTYEFEPTDENGFTSRSFDILSAEPGQKIVIDVSVVLGDMKGHTQTFFLPWW